MIVNFSCKETQKIWIGECSKKLPRSIQPIARRKLRMLNNAKCLNDLLIPPNNRLEALKGNKKVIFSIRVNQQWRICFKWENNHAVDVEIIDYH